MATLNSWHMPAQARDFAGKEVNMETEYVERLTVAEERSKSNTHRLDKLEPIVNEIHTMSVTMASMVEALNNTNKDVNSLGAKVDKMNSRVNAIEKMPADDFKTYKRTVLTAIISTITGAVVSGLLILLAQYIV